MKPLIAILTLILVAGIPATAEATHRNRVIVQRQVVVAPRVVVQRQFVPHFHRQQVIVAAPVHSYAPAFSFGASYGFQSSFAPAYGFQGGFAPSYGVQTFAAPGCGAFLSY